MRWRLLFSSLAEEKTEAEKDQVAPGNSYWATQLELKPKPFRFRSHALTCQIYGLSIYGLLRTDGFSHQNIVQSNYIVYLPGFHHVTSFWKAFAWFPHLAEDGASRWFPSPMFQGVGQSWYKAATREWGSLIKIVPDCKRQVEGPGSECCQHLQSGPFQSEHENSVNRNGTWPKDGKKGLTFCKVYWY